MINYIIIYALIAALIVSMITVLAELVTKRNSAAGKFFRAIRIRLREISRTSFCATALILLFWSLVSGDVEKGTVLAAILIIFATLFVLHPTDILVLIKRRKKAQKKKLLPLTPVLSTNVGEVPEAKLLPELTPAAADAEDKETEQ